MEELDSIIAAAVVGAIVAYIVTPVVRQLAGRWGIVAHPGGRRVHERPTPLLGGIAMYAGFVAAILVTAAISPRIRLDNQVWGILVGGTLVAL
ncbi:MAG: undecaprenyl/decaprenyl-phosphate alpha-N-acetylglucosaminyl 1-phosphate transferase, partial [Armatimonadetes bacterium]|nr:undecaprenyl/decaprenyl-phosphate alpha-N-acetylglucosaminyl 1-phosphate transferase [Armatimonadota bacterium]